MAFQSDKLPIKNSPISGLFKTAEGGMMLGW